jgi:sensor c-di-GMP phosphodiesterase-like protein
MQGYYFSKPLPADEFEQLLRQRRELPGPSQNAAERVAA